MLSLRSRLLLSIFLTLALSLMAGAAFTYWHAVRKIETEMDAAIAVGGFAVQVRLFVVTAPFDPGRRIAGRWFRLLGVATAKTSPLWDFRIHGEFPARLARKTVVVSNHVSNADAFLIAHLPWEMKWLGKTSLFKVPVVGWSMFLAGHVPVHRGQPDSARAALDLAAAAPAADTSGLESRLASNPDDHEARLQLADAWIAAGNRDDAADQLLEIISRDREWNDGAARKRFLQLLEAQGLEDPWSSAQRRRLSALLFT